MREVNFVGHHGNQESLERKFYEQTRIDDSDDVFGEQPSQVYELGDNDDKYLVVGRSSLTAERFEKKPVIIEAHKLAGEILDAAYPFFVSEMRASGLDCTEEDLKRHYLSKEDMRQRFVLVVDARSSDDESGKCVGRYDVRTHRCFLYLNDFIGEENKLLEERFIVAFIHELSHYVSKSSVNLKTEDQSKGKMHVADEEESSQSGYYEYEKAAGHDAFRNFNEGVTQLYSIEMIKKFLASLGRPRSSTKQLEDDLYRRNAGVVKKIIDFLSDFSGVPAETVWNGWKAGYLTGGVLNNPDVKQGLLECFGDDFLENFLADLGEKNPVYFLSQSERVPQPELSMDSIEKKRQMADHGIAVLTKILEKRWKTNGGKKVK